MAKNFFEAVCTCYEKNGWATYPSCPPGFLEDSFFLVRFGHLIEEIHELMRARAKNDLAGVADALTDIVFVATGIAGHMGLPFVEHWDETCRANWDKVPAVSAGESKRGHVIDLIKPPRWRAPDHETILRAVFTRWGLAYPEADRG